MTQEDNIYLGDGVYASFDGYQIWLAVNHHENKQVALEPKVMEALLEYANRVLGWGGYD
jgi:acyl-CoA thioesterase FadM